MVALQYFFPFFRSINLSFLIHYHNLDFGLLLLHVSCSVFEADATITARQYERDMYCIMILR